MSATRAEAQPRPKPSRLGKTVRDLFPLVIALVLFAVAEWYLLTEGWPLATWAMAGFLGVHGLIHLMFLNPKPPEGSSAAGYPFDPSRSWLSTRSGLAAPAVRGISAALSAVVSVGFVLAGLATLGLIVPVTWWPALVVGSSILSLALFALFLSPGLALGIAVDSCCSGWSGAEPGFQPQLDTPSCESCSTGDGLKGIGNLYSALTMRQRRQR